MNSEAIFAAQTALKNLIETAATEFEDTYPEVQNVTFQHDYTGEGKQAIRLVVNLESNGESITRKV